MVFISYSFLIGLFFVNLFTIREPQLTIEEQQI